MGGMRGSSHKRVPIALKLPQLQNLVKRDRDGYRDEFLQQHRNYLSELEIFKLKPSKDSDRFAELVTFMSHVAPCYKSETAEFGPQLKGLLKQHGPVLHPTIRMKLVQALMLLRNRGVLNPTELLGLFFGLFQCQDKALRVLLYDHIVSDIKNINDKGGNPRLIKSIQSVVYGMLKDDSDVAAKKSLDIMVHLYRKRIWVDARTVNVIASALVAETPRLACTALNFFLNIDTQMADDDEEEEKQEAAQSEVNTHAHSKKTAKRLRSVKKSVKTNYKKARAGQSAHGEGGLFPAINLLHDPQGTAEKVFRRLRQSKQRFEVKLLMMNFISRVVGAHHLMLLSFYSYLQRYVASQQREVTHILAYLVQACHDLVPPDEVMPVIKAVAYNFVTERCPGEVMALGINTIREICKRIPALLEEEGMDFLVQDLAAYSKHKDKSVVVAARSFINFIREVYPSLLKTKDRGKAHDISARPAKYGVQKLVEEVDGADLLTLHEQGLLPLEGGTDEEEGGDLEEEDEEEEAPQLVELPGVSVGQGLGTEGGGMEGDNEEVEEGRGLEMEVGDDEESEEEEGMEEDEEEDGAEEDGRDKKEEIWESEEAGQDVGGVESKATKRVCRSKKSIRFARDVKGPGADEAVEEASTSKVRVPAHLRVDGTRILSAEDFQKIKQLKQQVADASRDRKPGRKRKPSGGGNGDVDDDDEDSDEGGDGGESFAVEPRQLQGYRKRRRATLEERLESVIRGREKFHNQTHAGGLTNLEKERKKNFLMVRKGKKSVKRKTRLGDKQAMALKRKGVKVQMKRDRRKKRRT